MTLGVVVNTLSGVLMLALGVFVLSVRSGGRGNRAFAVFAIAFGTAWILDNLMVEADHAAYLGRIVSGVLLVVASAGLALLAGAHPEPLRAHPRRDLGVALGVAVYVLLAQGAVYVIWFSEDVLQPNFLASIGGRIVFLAVAWGVLFFFAMRYAGVARNAPEVSRRYGLMSAALVLYPAFFLGGVAAGIAMRGDLGPYVWVGLVVTVSVLLAYLMVWGFALWRLEPPGGARWLPVMAVVMAFAGMVLAQVNSNNPGFGVSRTLMVIVLGYAIVKHQLLGIDLRVRWGVSKSVLAGVFVAMFFVVSELTAWFFEDRIGDMGDVDPTVVGIGAAGLLLFAISPLHQMADRIAARAVPVSSGMVDESRAAYREAVWLAYSDGRIDREDERALAKLAKVIGIDPEKALAVREEVESQEERKGGGR